VVVVAVIASVMVPGMLLMVGMVLSCVPRIVVRRVVVKRLVMVVIMMTMLMLILVIFVKEVGAVHGQRVLFMGLNRWVVVHGVRHGQWRWDVDWRDTRINVPVKVLQVKLLQIEKAAKDIVWHLDFEIFQDDVGESDNNRVDRVKLQTDRVRVEHADLRLDNLDTVQAELTDH